MQDPSRLPLINVGRPVQAHPARAFRREARAVPLTAHHDDLDVVRGRLSDPRSPDRGAQSNTVRSMTTAPGSSPASARCVSVRVSTISAPRTRAASASCGVYRRTPSRASATTCRHPQRVAWSCADSAASRQAARPGDRFAAPPPHRVRPRRQASACAYPKARLAQDQMHCSRQYSAERGYLLTGSTTAARPGLVEVTGGVALIAAAHRCLVWLSSGVRPAGHRGGERLKRGLPSSR